MAFAVRMDLVLVVVVAHDDVSRCCSIMIPMYDGAVADDNDIRVFGVDNKTIQPSPPTIYLHATPPFHAHCAMLI